MLQRLAKYNACVKDDCPPIVEAVNFLWKQATGHTPFGDIEDVCSKCCGPIMWGEPSACGHLPGPPPRSHSLAGKRGRGSRQTAELGFR